VDVKEAGALRLTHSILDGARAIAPEHRLAPGEIDLAKSLRPGFFHYADQLLPGQVGKPVVGDETSPAAKIAAVGQGDAQEKRF